MSTREAAGYLVQLKDLYLLSLSSGRPTRRYQQLTAAEVDEIVGNH